MYYYNQVNSLDSMLNIEIMKRKWAVKYKDLKAFMAEFQSRFTPDFMTHIATNISLLNSNIVNQLLILPLVMLDPAHFYQENIEMNDETKMRSYEKFISDE